VKGEQYRLVLMVISEGGARVKEQLIEPKVEAVALEHGPAQSQRQVLSHICSCVMD
jgi:hypothetical protein